MEGSMDAQGPGAPQRRLTPGLPALKIATMSITNTRPLQRSKANTVKVRPLTGPGYLG